MELFSKFSIDDACSFIPMYTQQQSLGISGDEREGQIVAIRFTKPKVWYDILDEYTGTVFTNVDSSKVYASMWTSVSEAPVAEPVA